MITIVGPTAVAKVWFARRRVKVACSWPPVARSATFNDNDNRMPAVIYPGPAPDCAITAAEENKPTNEHLSRTVLEVNGEVMVSFG